MGRWLHRIGVRAAERRRRVVLAWAAAALALLLVGGNLGGEFSEEFTIPGTDSHQAQELLARRFPEQSGGSARLVFGTDSGRIDEGPSRDAVTATLEAVRSLPDVAIVGMPFGGMGGEVSETGTAAYADVRYGQPIDELGSSAVDELDRTVEVGRGRGVRVELSGELPSYYQSPHLGGAELLLKVAAALVIMLVAFGSVLAMGLPLGLALLGLATGAALIRLLALVVAVPSSGLLLGVMLGLGVGIDYALFIVARHRQNLHEGVEVTESIGRSMATAGQAVVFAGATVIIAIGGLAVAGIPAATIMGASAAIVVAVMVLAAVTLLPALLGFVGDGIDRFRVPGLTPSRDADDNLWGRWARAVASRPWPYLLGSVVVLLLLASPVMGMRMAMPDASTASEGSTRRAAHEMLVDGFGAGFSGPLLLVVDLPADGGEGVLAGMRADLAADAAVARVSQPVVNSAGDTAVLQVTPQAAPQDDATQDLVHRLRADLVTPGAEVYIGGTTATHIDLTDRASERLLVFMATIIGLSLVLLVVVFRSLWVPVKAAAMNLLSIGAGYGAVVAVFQWGWGASLLGLDDPVPVVSMVPMIMFAVLFGLSMDYEVFLLSRTREEYARTGDNTGAVVTGISTTARVITSAALIMIVVFVGFALGDNVIIQQIGLGLAVAVLIDATIVRAVLVPSTMVLLGDRNWTIPDWLDRILPHLEIEGVEVAGPADQVEPDVTVVGGTGQPDE